MTFKELLELLLLVENLSKRHKEQIDILRGSFEEEFAFGFQMALQEEELRKAVSSLGLFCQEHGLFIPGKGERPSGTKGSLEQALLKRVRSLSKLETDIRQRMLSDFSSEEVWSAWSAKH